jgi:hypothetical protein
MGKLETIYFTFGRMSITRLFYSLAMLFICFSATAQTTPYHVFLIGDAGDDEMTTQTLDSLKSVLGRTPNSAVFFLGDNSYKDVVMGLGWKGFDSSANTQNKMRMEMNPLTGYKGAAYFVAGNHDWWNIMNIKRGQPKLKMEENFVSQNLALNPTIQNPGNTYLPQNGNPGPEYVELDNGKIRVIAIDTYWLIIAQFKANRQQKAAHEEQFYKDLDSQMADAKAKNQKIIIVCHHPVYYQRAVKKLPLWIAPKRMGQSDPAYWAYSYMSARLLAIIKKYPGTYFASGHMHAMQYHYRDGIHHIISGAGSKLIHVSQKKAAHTPACTANDCIYWNDKGFFELTFYNNHENITIYHNEGRLKTELK